MASGGAGDVACRFTPTTCMDDLCRSAEVGLCGNEEPDAYDNYLEEVYVDGR